MERTKRDHDYVQKQRKQLEKAEKFGAIPEQEAAITDLTLIVKQFLIEENMKDMIRYLEEKMDGTKGN